MNVTRRQGRFSSQSGFTAIEISAVATIIAILALVLIPIMRTRVEDAKIVAAKDDMMSIEKAQTLAFADTGRYFRLQDLTRPAVDPGIVNNPNDPNYARELGRVPQAQWNRELMEHEIVMLSKTWRGTQISMHRTELIQRLLETSPYLFTEAPQTGGGPILVLGNDAIDDVRNAAESGVGLIRYPLDPWGNPYIFFGPGTVTDPVTASGQVGGLDPNFGPETHYGTAIVYSLGPDGRPGNTADVTNPLVYYRNLGIIGQGDDLSREF